MTTSRQDNMSVITVMLSLSPTTILLLKNVISADSRCIPVNVCQVILLPPGSFLFPFLIKKPKKATVNGDEI